MPTPVSLTDTSAEPSTAFAVGDLLSS